MRQTLHIFLKDVRHLKWEVLLMLCLLVAFVATEPRHWRPLYEIGTFQQLTDPIQILMGLAWCYIMVRLVHEEALAGDRQFWITRPYSWKSLWAAKVLFVVIFINLPILIGDAILLAAAGFPPGSHLPVLVWKQVALSAGLAAAGAVASVTRSLVEFGVAGLIVALYSVALGLVYRQWPVADWIEVSVLTAILLAAASAVAWYQYARRRTAISRVALVCLALVMLLTVSGITWNMVVTHRFAAQAAQTSGSPVLTLDSDPGRRPTNKPVLVVGDIVPLSIPFKVAGLPEGTDIDSEIARVTIEAPGGKSRQSYGDFHYSLTAAKSGEARFYIRQSLFDDIKSTPVTLRFSVLLTLLRDGRTTRVVLHDGDFTVPDFLHCASFGARFEFPLCRTTLFRPGLLRMRVDVPDTCRSLSSAFPQEPPSRAPVGWHPRLMDLDISPVSSFYLSLRQRPNLAKSDANAGAPDCSGTQVEFTTEVPVGHIRRDVEINGVRLADYAIKVQR